MFETAELGSKVAKSEYKQRAPILRQELLDLQRELRESGQFPVIIVFAGVDGAGKTQTINLLNQWMAPWEFLLVHHDRAEFWQAEDGSWKRRPLPEDAAWSAYRCCDQGRAAAFDNLDPGEALQHLDQGLIRFLDLLVRLDQRKR